MTTPKPPKRGRGRPEYSGRDWHRAMLMWSQMENLRLDYRERGANAPYELAMEDLRKQHGFQSWEAAKKFIARSLKSAPPEVRAARPSYRELNEVFDEWKSRFEEWHRTPE